jgi:hypothetical protein
VRPLTVIAVGALAVAAVAFWKLRSPPVGGCTANRLSSAASSDAQLTAHVEARTCDERLKAGLFVMVEKASEPGTLYEAFYSGRRLSGAGLRWSGECELEITFPEPLSTEERGYADQTVAGIVAVKLKAP